MTKKQKDTLLRVKAKEVTLTIEDKNTKVRIGSKKVELTFDEINETFYLHGDYQSIEVTDVIV